MPITWHFGYMRAGARGHTRISSPTLQEKTRKMSATQSNLSASQYGYDVVVSTTQGSINATLKEFLSAGTEPVAVICYVADNNGNPTPIDCATLMTNANGSDPFAVPANADPATDQDLINLFNARFMAGFKAQIGLPAGYAPTGIPDVVTLGADASSVTYTLLCSQFTVVQYTPASGYTPAQWMNQSQPAGAAWLFTSKVSLQLTPAQAPYSNLPPAVQAQIENLGSQAFSVQQLLFDLDTAALETTPVISGVPAGSTLYSCLQRDFIGAYFSAMQQSGAPLLGCAITQSTAAPSTLTLSDLNFETSPLLDGNDQPIPSPTPAQLEACTLNYLCAANGDVLPAAAPFGWNWIEETEESSFNGVMAINRNAFAKYFQGQLNLYVMRNCMQPVVQVTRDGLGANWGFWMTQGTPTVTTPTTGAMVLSYAFSGQDSDQAGWEGALGKMKMSSSFSLSVSFSGNTVTITQNLIVYVYIWDGLSASGNIIDKTYTDVYTLAVNASGQLTATLVSTPVDKSQSPGMNGFLNFFTGVNQLIDDAKTWAEQCIATGFTDLPLSVVQNFVFPGGQTFAFKDVTFSENQDLVAHITYVDPN